MKFKKVWQLGGEKKLDTLDDYIAAYGAENGKRIECMHGFSNWSLTWYEVDGLCFDTLKDAKAYVIG